MAARNTKAAERSRKPATTEATPPPTVDEIRARAHLKWIDARCPDGDGIEFWLDAESELMQERGGSPKPVIAG